MKSKPIMPKCPANYFGKGENYVLNHDETAWFMKEVDKWNQEYPNDPDGTKTLAAYRQERAEWEIEHTGDRSEARVKPQLLRVQADAAARSEREELKIKKEERRFQQELTLLRQRQRMRHSDISKALLVKLVRQASKEGCSVEVLVDALLSKRIIDWRYKQYGI